MNGQADEERRYRAVLALDERSCADARGLLELLYDESWRVRAAAAERLARLPQGDVVPSLLVALSDRRSAGARNSAAEVLSRLGVAAAPAVIALMSHPEPDQRRFAADILGAMRLREGTAALLNSLEDPDLNVRVSTAEALARIGGDGAAEVLQRLLNDTEPLIRLAALRGLWELRSPLPLRQLLPLLADEAMRATAYRLLGLIPDPAAATLICQGLTAKRSVCDAALAALAVHRSLLDASRLEALEAKVREVLGHAHSWAQVLASALSREERGVRQGALFVAAALGDASLAPLIAEAARDEPLAADAVLVLGRLGPAGAEALLAGFDSLSRPARVAALRSLGFLANSAHVRRLAEFAARGDPEIQLVAIEALGRCGLLEAVEPLVQMLGDEQLAPAAERALLAIAHRSDAPVLEALLRAARDADPQVRAAAIGAGAEIGHPAAIEVAGIGLADSEPVVRRAGARALGSTNADSSESLLRRALSDPDAWVQAAAIEAAGDVGCVRLAPELEALAGSVDGLRAARAVRALAQMKMLSPSLWQTAIGHRDPDVVKEALLAGTGGQEAASKAVELLSHQRWDVRAAAARALAYGGQPEARALLCAALQREADPLAREALRDAMQLMR